VTIGAVGLELINKFPDTTYQDVVAKIKYEIFISYELLSNFDDVSQSQWSFLRDVRNFEPKITSTSKLTSNLGIALIDNDTRFDNTGFRRKFRA
jgi:hypothetical protein